MRKIVTVLLVTCCFTMADTTILCIGDSITEGGSSFSTYRYPLYRKLKEDRKLKKIRVAVRFIGPKSSTLEGVILRHAGYSGRDPLFLDKNFGKIYSQYKADIILLHSVHKHTGAAENITRRLKSIIVQARKINPKVKVFLAQGITSGKLKYSYIPAVNIEIKKLAKSLNVICVDQSSDFNWEMDTIHDRIHPNKNGAEKMAKNWFFPIRAYLLAQQN